MSLTNSRRNSHATELPSFSNSVETVLPPAEEETLSDSVEVADVGPLLKAELYGTEKELRLANYVTNAEASRKTAGSEGTFLLYI
jgi:ethanolamine utilization protein EutA (predicted chaperonin)